MNKKITIGAKPQLPDSLPGSPEEWVQSRQIVPPPKEPMKRLTLDIPERLHAQFKSHCALRGVSMADHVQRLIEQDLAPKG